MKKFYQGLSRQGSALLIVLGFLSFMMVSAVSFAIYMRIERQASSNFRHAITARHMLNAALYRAIDEIDGELRIEKISDEAEARSRKFPDWPGRTRPSAVANGLDNSQEARVLSMEALSFIPGVLVNDVRRYAVTNRSDTVSGVGGNRQSYLGAKWRTLSMPVSSVGCAPDWDAPNANEEAVVGRYSYVCINVSDMLNVNVCKAAIRDANTNRVSIGHLFGPNSQAARESFDNYVKTRGIHFETLQDFYACMFNNAAGAAIGSPYHEYMTAGNGSDADVAFDQAGNHVFVTDGIVKAQPANATACNILLQQPFAPGVLSTKQMPSVPFQNTTVQGRDTFQDALVKVFSGGGLPAGANACLANIFPVMLADYIDEDNVPKMLNTPSVEMVPMVSQILIPPFFRPRIMETIDAVQPTPPPATPVKTFWLNAVPLAGPAMMQVQVELVWPYKRLQDRTCPDSSTYEVEVQAYLKLHTDIRKSDGFKQAPIAANGYLKLVNSAIVKAPNFSSKNDDNPSECYKMVMVPLLAQGGVTRLDFAKNAGALTPALPDYALASPLYVSLIVFARVRNSNGLYVDSAPQGALPCPRFGGMNDDQEFANLTGNKLYFQTAATAFNPAADSVGSNGKELPYDWTSLEVPDPRFNYKAANWIQNTSDGAGIPVNGINPSTTALLGKEGRDGDVFMSVSDAGKLQSPGELGFILRPFKYDVGIGVTAAVDFRTRTAVDPSVDDSDAYFRTIRLYDHDNANPADKLTRAKDPIYQYFTAQNADESVAGARVNPLSNLPQVLAAAIDQTPVDYWFASRDVNTDETIMRDNIYNKFLASSDWNKFTNAWLKCFTYLRTTSQGKKMRTSLQYGLPDYYGDYNTFGWYSAGDPLTIFSPNGYAAAGVPASLSTPLHEIDRKMLYSFSLDSFSDRQQLFLYILRAEVTVPSFGSSQESGTKSLAGGRAVALVWRDPYPVNYDKAANSYATGDWYTYLQRFSPWYQVNIARYDDNYEESDTSGDPSIKPNPRSNGFHQQRILFFKQLDD